jgi:uncharacterized protein (TIGR03032 family)
VPPEDPSAAASPSEPRATYREVKFRHSRDFVKLLHDLGATLLVSTYQAGKLVAVGAPQAKLSLSFHNFEQAMGIAVHPDRIAVGSRGVIWFLQNSAELAPRIEPPGRYDACYLARGSFITGNIHGHEMAYLGDELWVVNTLFSCLCTLDEGFSFVPRWQPPFISQLEANDRCHLNGLAVADGRVRYVTVMAESNEPGGWRPKKADSGCVLEVASGQRVSGGLSMPHSPRVHGGKLWVLNSGLGSLETVDPLTGRRDVVTQMPGYTRGLAFCGDFAVVGLSRIRETAVFGGVPIAEHREELKCGVAIVDVRSGQSVAYLEFESGVEEIFDVQVLAATRCASITGPYPLQDDAKDVWVVPPPGHVPQSAGRFGGLAAGARAPQSFSNQDMANLVASGVAAQQEGRAAQAVEIFQQAAAARPNSAEIQNHLGNAYQEASRQDLALACYRQAVAVDEGFAPAHQNLGYLLVMTGHTDLGLASIARAQQLRPSGINRVMLATCLPVIYASSADARARRERLEENVQQLVDEGLQINVTNATVPTNFFSAYLGHNDRDVQRNLAKIYRAPQPVQAGFPQGRHGRLRVGFLSAHLCDHTIGRLNLGRVERLDRRQFETIVLAVGRHQDALATRFRQAADSYVEVSARVEAARRQVVDARLDVLVLPDVGMNALTYALAFSRMAPVQCVGWGHPVTTGSPAIDYFLSSRLLETDLADEHYTERLVRFENLGTYYFRPRLGDQRRTRESFGLDPARHLYLCPQTLFKMHPDFDAILAEILRRDPLGDLVLLEGRQKEWVRLLEERFSRTLGDVASRVRFLPSQPNADFLELNRLADVLVDPPHFGGGNTSYEAFAMGTPIVTLPSPYLRGRITLALYRKMRFMDCVVDSNEQYVDLAVRLGTDRDYRRVVSESIERASDALYEDPAEAAEFSRFLSWIGAGAKGPFETPT